MDYQPPPKPVRRIQTNVLATSERRLLNWLCGRMPDWVTPDRLTALAFASAIVMAFAYAMSTFDLDWLWLAIAGYVVHWFGDSLDGSLARYRKIERPAYGYFIDHSCDGLATLVILAGIGLSPFLRLDVALFAVAAYLLLAVHSFLLAKVAGEMPLSQGAFGPTEIRLVLMGVTLAMYCVGTATGDIGAFSAFDIVFGTASAIMVGIFIGQTLLSGRRLLAAERLRGR